MSCVGFSYTADGYFPTSRVFATVTPTHLRLKLDLASFYRATFYLYIKTTVLYGFSRVIALNSLYCICTLFIVVNTL